MTVQNNPPAGGISDQDDDQTQQVQQGSVSPAVKEQESGQSSSVQKEKEILAEIIKSSEAADQQAEHEIRSVIAEARLATPEPKIPPEVADTGVKAPQEEANKVVTEGSTIELPMTEQEYKTGLHQKVKAVVIDKVIVGTSSLFALAALVGRLIKIAHKHTMRVIFRKPFFVKTSEGKEGD